MTDAFVTVEVETDAQSLADAAVTSLQTTWPGWEPNDGDMEVVQIEALAPMAADAAETASRMFPAAFRAYGTKLIGLTYQAGAAATGHVTFTLTDTAGHTIPAGSEIDIDGFAFRTDSDAVVAPASDTAAAVPVTAAVFGVDANALTGAAVSPISALAFVASITLDAPTANGEDPETDTAYQDRLSRQLELQAKTLVVPRDFVIEALDYPGVGRALAFNTGPRDITVVLTDNTGQPVSTPIKDALEAIFLEFEQANTVFTMDDPDYTTINVAYTVKAEDGFDGADLVARVNAALSDVLDPANWGRPKNIGDPGSTSGWKNEPVVRVNKLIDLIGDVDGVDYVLGLNIAASGGTPNGVPQVDKIDFTGTVSGGTYTLTFNGQTTAAIPYNASAADVIAPLTALSNLEPGEVSSTGGPGPTDITLTWVGRYSNRAVTFTRTSSVTGGGSMAITSVQAATPGTGDWTIPGVAPLTVAGGLTGYVF